MSVSRTTELLEFTTIIKGVQIGANEDLVFENSDSVNTQITVNFTKPTKPLRAHLIEVNNPSTVTDLTVKVFTMNGVTPVFSFSVIVPASATITGTSISAYSFIVSSLFVFGNTRMVISNDTVLGGGDAFTGTIALYEV